MLGGHEDGIFSYKTAWLNEPNLGRKHLWKVLYADYTCRLDPLTYMRNIYGRSSIKSGHFIPDINIQVIIPS
jgi:hypothetical protein